jgi:hypothetical protein
MNSPEADNRRPAGTDGAFLDLQRRAKDSNVNPNTLLATDYLNHFNEVVMLLEMIPDMPEMLEEAKAWRPKAYKEHFQSVAIADRELAIEAYDHVPPAYKEPFEKTVAQLDALIATSISRLEHDVGIGDPALLRSNAVALSRVIQRLLEVASGIIHGSSKTLDQAEIDALIGA